MKLLRTILFLMLALGAGASRGASGATDSPRTDINPALIYWQAMAQLPDLEPADSAYFSTTNWQGRPFDSRMEALLARFDVPFGTVERAARQVAACDWGYDLTLGPELYLPSLAKAKSIALAARLRARWHLEHGRPDSARRELAATLVLGRQVSRDGVLISALVQIAIENILTSAIAENWFRFDQATLDQLVEEFLRAPARGGIVACVATERTAFRDWFVLRLEQCQREATSDADSLERARKLLRSMGEETSDLPDRALRAAGGTVTGLIRTLKELDPVYDEAAVLLALPYEAFAAKRGAFDTKVKNHPNVLAQELFPMFSRCRSKEFAAEARIAMVRAAVEYRRLGEAGLDRVPDPLTGKRFQFKPIAIDGVDRGFELRSEVVLRDMPEAQIFVEHDGPALFLDGPRVGQLRN